MNFNKHLDLEGQHAFLGASKYHWIRYDEEKLEVAFKKYLAVQKGTELHEFACFCIRIGQRLPKSKKCLNAYVNDAIGFRMVPEQLLYYSENAFGTADAISFRENKLRIYDLKTGITPVSMDQLLVYTALFCLEYDVKPFNIEMELRVYQENEVLLLIPPPEDILSIMEKIIVFDKKIERMKLEEEQ